MCAGESGYVFFVEQTTAYECRRSLVGSDMYIRDRERLGDGISSDFKSHYLKGADELELVRSGLDDTMRVAYQQMREIWRSRDDVPDLRTAA